MVLSGAGISVSCGIPDFRSKDGIYATLQSEGKYELDDPQDMFDKQYFLSNPSMFYSFAHKIFPSNFAPAPHTDSSSCSKSADSCCATTARTLIHWSSSPASKGCCSAMEVSPLPAVPIRHADTSARQRDCEGYLCQEGAALSALRREEDV